MRKKLFLTRGTLGLALAASVFLGCQDFLGGDNGKPAAAPVDDNVDHAAQAAVAQDSAKDMPAQTSANAGIPAAQPAAIEPSKPAVTDPAIPAATEPAKPTTPTEPANPSPSPSPTGLTPEQQVCLDLYNGLQTTKDPEYGEYKNKYGSLNCDVVLGDKKPVPPPLTIEEKCKMYRYNVIHSTPATPDPKYEAYMAEMAITCAAYP